MSARYTMLISLPIANCVFVFLLMISLGEEMFETGAFWAAIPLQCLTTIVAFFGCFHPNVRNALAWATVAVCGTLVIVNFALTFQSAGVICAAPLCPSATVEVIKATEVPVYRDTVASVYFSIVSFTTLGYGDLQPHPDLRLLAAMQALYGYMFLGFLVSAAVHWTTGTFVDEKQGERIYRTRVVQDEGRHIYNVLVENQNKKSSNDT